jgi:hypothetical protein
MKRKLFWGLIPAMCIAVLVLLTGCGTHSVHGLPATTGVPLS